MFLRSFKSGRNIQHDEFRRAMGNPETGLFLSKWPDEGVSVREIDGFRCRVLPRGKGGRHAPHRAQIQCQQCTKWIFQGRLHQHVGTDACLNNQG